MAEFDRITRDPAVMGGKPCIRGMQLKVATIAGMIRMGITVEKLLADHPFLEREDVLQVLAYAASRIKKPDLKIMAF